MGDAEGVAGCPMAQEEWQTGLLTSSALFVSPVFWIEFPGQLLNAYLHIVLELVSAISKDINTQHTAELIHHADFDFLLVVV